MKRNLSAAEHIDDDDDEGRAISIGRLVLFLGPLSVWWKQMDWM